MSDIVDLFEECSLQIQKLEDSSPREATPLSPIKEGLPEALKKAKFPPASKKLYFPIISSGGGLNCLPFASTGISTVSFFKTLPRDVLRVPVDNVVRTDHKNLVNVQELYLAPDALTLTYDSWGISLLEISQRCNIFARDEIAVATICRETLRGLSYIHHVVGIAHANISCGTVILTENGVVKITDVGESMLQPCDDNDKYLDCQAVCQIANVLLELDSTSKTMTSLRREAGEFADTPLGVTVDDTHFFGELLNHALCSPSQFF
ncbi:hypothetical protein BJX63DRAFT_438429 [Aspergillus granulosus]|uniref:Protein kinase domain-containing protein n=1 Tax=Aspergillus granulosus TaxID=176169 RepID=A0ABR4GS16_9EURO